MFRDLRYSLRLLHRSPGFTVTAVCTFAVAIGVNIAVFNVVDRVLLQPLPIRDANHVVIIWPREKANPTTVGEVSYWAFRAWQQQARSFETLAAIGSVNWSLVLGGSGEPATLPVAAVSASFFPLLGTRAAIGRTLLPEDDRRGADRVAVMAHSSWIRRFGADPTIVGRRLMLSGAPYTVVGVMSEGFDYPRGAELWVPVVPQLVDAGATWRFDALTRPGFGVLFVLGRLHPSVSVASAQAEVSALIARDAGMAFVPGMEAVVTPIREQIFGKTRSALLVIAASVGLVLLIACANIAGLLLVRVGARAHETAVRVAMGATRWRILRLSLADAVVLSAFGGAAGLLLAHWTIRGVVALAPPDVPRLDAVRVDGRTLAFAWIACAVAAVLAGLAPGLHAFRQDVGTALKAGGGRLTRSHALRRAFVTAQIALAMSLLLGAALVGRSFLNLLQLNLGFDPVNVLTVEVTVPDAEAARRRAFYQAFLDRVRALPGVDAASAVLLRPLEHTGVGNDAMVAVEGQRIDSKTGVWEHSPTTNYEAVTPDYFRTMRIKVLRGRDFSNSDTNRAPQVAIVSQDLAERLWPGQHALGKRLLQQGAPRDASGQPLWSTVVGVVDNVRYRGLTDLRFDLYVPYLQASSNAVKHVMVRTSVDPLALGPAIRAEARRLDPTALFEAVTTMDDMVGRAVAPWRFGASALGILSALAIGLAALGVYGIVSQSTVDRMREIAIRTALGAGSGDILRLVVADGVVFTTLGIGVGLALGVSASRVLSGLLFGVRAADPMTLAVIPMLFLGVALIGMLLPVRRALRVDPAVALRLE
jgi:putative ABC transport system permease protein